MSEMRALTGEPEAEKKHGAHVRRDVSARRGLRWLSLLALAAWPLLAWGAARALIVRAELPHADALVVLGGSSTYKERTRLAAELFAQGRAPKIVLTDDGERGSWSREEERNPFFVERAGAELRRAGVSTESIEVLSPIVASTYEEARALRGYAASHNVRSLLVVTSGYHSRRALWTFRRVFEGSGVQIGLAPVTPGEQTPRPALWWLAPAGWRLVAGEYAKLIYYLLHYR